MERKLDKIRISIDLGNGEQGERRKDALLNIAEMFGFIGQRGPSPSLLLQQLADGRVELGWTMINLYEDNAGREYLGIDQ